jgi:DNA-binding transcriptional LysR family regulator
MSDLNDVSVLVRVIELGSFAKVARELGVPTSTVARAISRLEESLQMRLIQRTTRSLAATSEGLAFYEDTASAVATIQRASRSVANADRTPRGVLRIAVTSEIATWLLASSIVRFTSDYPLVRVELELSSRNVNLVEEGFDVAIRLGPLHDSSLVSSKLVDLHAQIYASSAYVAKNGAPPTLAELEHHPCVLFRARNGVSEWVLDGPEGPVKQTVRGSITSDDYGVIRALLLDGAGVGRLPRMMALEDVRQDRLVRVLPEYDSAARSLHYIHESTRTVAPKIDLFRATLIDELAHRELEWRVLDDKARARRGPANK